MSQQTKEEHSKLFIVKSYNLPFEREYTIYNNWVSSDKSALIEKIRIDLEEEVLLDPVQLKLKNDWLLVNDSPQKWLKIVELDVI
ncbi:Uncharacterised protein [Chryseobacterium gleum]|uniref:Uncharacterized protein n=2 Tax=Chryseobacterium gleum TaxID=250 RepID=A0A3S4QZF5_CHRGE|nr:hypothetical protein [Chryseobacterium gleum]QQY32060.1 hypothetical protein I6I60_25065 [Chryseobacterium gleum]VEE10719.1 Uncharacterised protein [Chryseobacterium gleum]